MITLVLKELSLVRRGQSFDSYKTSEKEDGFFRQRLTPSEEEEELTTRKSVSVSHVRVEVSRGGGGSGIL